MDIKLLMKEINRKYVMRGGKIKNKFLEILNISLMSTFSILAKNPPNNGKYKTFCVFKNSLKGFIYFRIKMNTYQDNSWE